MKARSVWGNPKCEDFCKSTENEQGETDRGEGHEYKYCVEGRTRNESKGGGKQSKNPRLLNAQKSQEVQVWIVREVFDSVKDSEKPRQRCKRGPNTRNTVILISYQVV